MARRRRRYAPPSYTPGPYTPPVYVPTPATDYAAGTLVPEVAVPYATVETFPAVDSPRYHPPIGSMVRRVTFASIGDLAKHAEEFRPWNGSNGFSPGWYGDGKTLDECISYLKQGGVTRHAAAALALADAVEMPSVETYKDEAVFDVAGGMPLTAPYLSGDPACMLDMRPVRSDRGPVRIHVQTSSSSGVPAETMMAAGAAIMALGQVVSQVRPVELWYSVLGSGRGDDQAGHACMIRVRLSTPFSLAEAGLMFGAYGITRGLAYGLQFKCGPTCQQTGNSGAWAFRGYSEIREGAQQSAACTPEITEHDLFLGGTSLEDAAVSPQAWLDRHVKLAIEGQATDDEA